MTRAPFRHAIVAALLAAVSIGSASAATGVSMDERVRIKRLVITEARRMRFPVALALAVAHTESGFDARARSRKGARGVMQIMPATSIGEYGLHPDVLWDPRINIRMGIHFLKRLLARYRGRTDLALSYYNGGSAVGVWPDAKVMPATTGYVNRVQRLRFDYQRRLVAEGELL